MREKRINLNSNDDFILLSAKELRQLMIEIEKYDLEYRTTLNLPSDLTFGTELEFEDANINKVNKFIQYHFKNWVVAKDGTVETGGEINSPIMLDQTKDWQELKAICLFLKKINAKTNNCAGGHIHIGVNALGNNIQSWKAFLKLYMAYESIIFRFAMGDKLTMRSYMGDYAMPIAADLKSKIQKINYFKSVIELPKFFYSQSRYHAINFENIDFYDINTLKNKNTIEFRSPNATTNHIIWQNNINAFAKMILSSKNLAFDVDFIDYKIKHEFVSYYQDRYLYKNVCLKNALEFVDLIFDNNLDKIYFLKQYLKSFQEDSIISKSNNPPLAKKFTK